MFSKVKVEDFPCIIWDRLDYFEFSHLGGTISHIRKENVIPDDQSHSESAEKYPCNVFQPQSDLHSYACMLDITLFLNQILVSAKFRNIAATVANIGKLHSAIVSIAEKLSVKKEQVASSSLNDSEAQNTLSEAPLPQAEVPEIDPIQRPRNRKTKESEVNKRWIFTFFLIYKFLFLAGVKESSGRESSPHERVGAHTRMEHSVSAGQPQGRKIDAVSLFHLQTSLPRLFPQELILPLHPPVLSRIRPPLIPLSL